MNEIPYMINNGAFGTFNPYVQQQMPMGNMIPVGAYGYNQPQQQNDYVFKPVGGGYTPNPYQQQNYYNPFPYFQQVQQQQYPNPYSQFGYNNYSPFMSMQRQQELIQMEIDKEKMKARYRAHAMGIEVSEEELDIRFNPNNKVNVQKREEIEKQRDPIWEELCYINSVFWTSPLLSPKRMNQMNYINSYYANCRKEFGSHSMFEFLEIDLPKLLREEWISEHIKPKQNRNLGATYNSEAYNELLNMHRSSNPYINEILDQSRYDNNIDDAEVGLAELFDRERRKINLLTGKLPTFVSSPEVQAARAKYTQELMDALYKKENKVVNNSV